MDMLREQDFDQAEPAPVEGITINASSEPSDAHPRSNLTHSNLKMKIAIPLAIILCGVAVVALISLFEQPAANKADVVTTLGVATVAIKSRDMNFSIAAQGTVAPRTETALVTEVSGVVQSVSPKLQVGGFFEKNEILLTIDAGDYEASVKQAEANLLGKKAQLTQELAQTQQAEKEWAMSGRPKKDAPILALRQPFLEEATAGVLFAEAELDRAQRKLARTRIRAPYDGLVKSKNIGVGQYVTVGTLLAEVVAVDYAEVRLALSDEDIAFLQLPTARDLLNKSDQDVGDQTAFKRPTAILSATVGGKEYQWPATIDRTEGVIDARSRVHYAVARVKDPYGLHAQVNDSQDPELSVNASPKPNPKPPGPKQRPALSIGSYVKAQIEGISMSDIFVVPRDAFRDENTLMVVDADNRLRLRETNVVRSDKEFVYITSGIQPGEEVITTGMVAPVDGMQVRKLAAQ